MVERRSLADRATDALREMIVTGICPPGSRITEQRFAEELGLSRGTVRAALRELAHEGLTEMKAYTGWSVVTLTAQDARELSTLRGALEGLAARLAA
ncbi:MAG TPA: GntR family transcriptional regulator, partial [Paracoccaceae bacterium]|nr:GntR family transcriptional regulator [Paracoccaceae bacterium]